jgi:hypothetical protein
MGMLELYEIEESCLKNIWDDRYERLYLDAVSIGRRAVRCIA